MVLSSKVLLQMRFPFDRFYFLLFVFVITWSQKQSIGKLFFFLGIFFASTLPFILFKNDAAVLENRFYIFPALWANLLLVSILSTLFQNLEDLKTS